MGPFNVCSLDPGVRTFQTVYSPDGSSYKIGHEDAGRLIRMNRHLSNLQSKINCCKKFKSKRKVRKLFKYRKAYFRLSSKIRNMVDELHKKTIAFLVSRFNTIIIPDTNIIKMVSRKFRNISKGTVKSMLMYFHYRFRERLLMKSKICNNLKVHVIGEEYTTKTCGRCGILNDKIGSKKEFKCNSCKIRNIFIKYITERAIFNEDGVAS